MWLAYTLLALVLTTLLGLILWAVLSPKRSEQNLSASSNVIILDNLETVAQSTNSNNAPRKPCCSGDQCTKANTTEQGNGFEPSLNLGDIVRTTSFSSTNVPTPSESLVPQPESSVPTCSNTCCLREKFPEQCFLVNQDPPPSPNQADTINQSSGERLKENSSSPQQSCISFLNSDPQATSTPKPKPPSSQQPGSIGPAPETRAEINI